MERTKAIKAMIQSHTKEIDLLHYYLKCLHISDPNNKAIHRDFRKLIREHFRAKFRYIAMLHSPNIKCNLDVNLVQFHKSLS